MTYEEFLTIDKHNAFAEFISVKKAKQLGIIPELFHKHIKEKCLCGSDIIISANRKTMTCCDPKCYIKMGFALSKLFNNFSCENLGPATCSNLIKMSKNSFKYNSHLELLIMTDKELPYSFGGSVYGDFLIAKKKMLSRDLTLAEIISKIAIPSFGGESSRIFKNVSTFDDLMNKIKQSGSIEKYLATRDVFDKKRAFYLRAFLLDIAVAENFFSKHLQLPAMQDFPICITGSIKFRGCKINKEDFIYKINTLATLSDGYRLFNFRKNEAYKTNKYILYSTPSSNNKYVHGKKREDSLISHILRTKEEGEERDKLLESCRILYTPDEFYQMIEQKIKEVRDRCQIALEKSY